MPFVEIYKTNNDGLQEIAAICELNKEFVVCKGEKIFIENLKKDGIYNYSRSPHQKIFPKDGLHFLEQLKYNFKSGYFNASEVKDDKNYKTTLTTAPK